MTATVYARFSSDLQRATSIDERSNHHPLQNALMPVSSRPTVS